MVYIKVDKDEHGGETVTTVTTNGGKNAEGYHVDFSGILNGILTKPEKATRIDVNLPF